MSDSIEKISVSCTTQECNNVTTPSYPISTLLSVQWSLMGGKKQKEFVTFSSKIGQGKLMRGGCLQEVLNIVI